MAEVKQSDVIIPIKAPVRVKYTGNVTEIMYQDKRNREPTVIKISKDKYIDCKTGEIKTYSENKEGNRLDNTSEIKRSLARLRDYINTNVTQNYKARFLTATYHENMTDTERLNVDLKRFYRKLRKVYGHFEYITAREPQGRGAWHIHSILIFDKKAPYMSTKDVFNAWDKKGHVSIKAIESVDNLGAYVTAYMGDIEYTQAVKAGLKLKKGDEIKEVKDKKYIKGARMRMYPTGFNIYSTSKGIKKPEIYYKNYGTMLTELRNHERTYSKSIEITGGEFDKKIRYDYYKKLT